MLDLLPKCNQELICPMLKLLPKCNQEFELGFDSGFLKDLSDGSLLQVLTGFNIT
jgi:hypothetical protein